MSYSPEIIKQYHRHSEMVPKQLIIDWLTNELRIASDNLLNAPNESLVEKREALRTITRLLQDVQPSKQPQ